MHRTVLTGLMLTLAMMLFSGPSRAAEEQSGQVWAVLIGAERYRYADPLRYTNNDVKQLARTLEVRGGYPVENIVQLVDTQADEQLQPIKKSIEATLPMWLAKAEPQDCTLVYFSGHGIRDGQGKLYLAPIDCRADDPAATAVPVEWLREELIKCKARFKLLVIDACHAGSEKGDEEAAVTAKELGDTFRNLAGIITLASSGGDEKSQIWDDHQQSLFSFWLNQGLKGHADGNSDAVVDVFELHRYVERNVSRVARRLGKRQHPELIAHRAISAIPAVIRLRPQTLDELLADIAEQLSVAMFEVRLSQGGDEPKLSKLGVVEFTNADNAGEFLGADYGLLGKYCARKLEEQLLRFAAPRFSVVDPRRLQQKLISLGFGIDDLGKSDRLAELSDQMDGMPVLAVGTLQNRVGRVISVRCELVRTDTEDKVAAAGGVAQLNHDEWGMIGRSAWLTPHERVLLKTRHAGEEDLVDVLDHKARASHPLLPGSEFPFGVEIKVAGRTRDLVFVGSHAYVGLDKGEEFEIRVENKLGTTATMRLLVDGLNTLPQPELAKDVHVDVVAPRVNLAQARHWVLLPDRGTRFAIRGFFHETGPNARFNRFRVTGAAQSLAVRRQYTEQLGLITAAFYQPNSGRGPSNSDALGVTLGSAGLNTAHEVRGYGCDELLGVVQIRYVTPDAMPVDPRTVAVVTLLDLPEGATVVVDGRDYGTRREFSYRRLVPGTVYRSQFEIRLPSGQVIRRSVAIEGGGREILELENEL